MHNFSFDDFTAVKNNAEEKTIVIRSLTEEQAAMFIAANETAKSQYDAIVSSYLKKVETTEHLLGKLKRFWPDISASCKDMLLELESIEILSLHDCSFVVTFSPIFVSATKKFTFIPYGDKDVHLRSENHASVTKLKNNLEKCFVLNAIGMEFTVKGSEFYIDARKNAYNSAMEKFNALPKEEQAETPQIGNFLKIKGTITMK